MPVAMQITLLIVAIIVLALLVLAGMAVVGAVLGARDERRRKAAVDAMIDDAIEKGNS
jgi:NADH:ubiquinone oxidoreductase subunit 3 (subunit A)